MKKKVLLLGGLGVIGTILTPALSNKYEVVISDVKEEPPNINNQYLHINVSDIRQLIERIPKDINVIVNLTALPEMPKIVSEEIFSQMTDIYITGSYNVFLAAKKLRISKVLFASTNHVTGRYEENGRSIIGREINITDYPISNSIYGAMKLCAEQFGQLFSNHFGLSVICLRIGTVRNNEYEFLLDNDRARRTILSAVDTVGIFTAAIESKVQYGVYYAVSDNPERPWSIQEAIEELEYLPKVNSNAILRPGGISR